jgi:nucleotide-binding universal stress UspA family protein
MRRGKKRLSIAREVTAGTGVVVRFTVLAHPIMVRRMCGRWVRDMSEKEQDRWAHPAVILAASDLSDLERIVPFAIDQAVWTGAKLVLLHVIAPTEAMGADAGGMPMYDPVTAAEATAKGLAPWVELAGQRGVKCETAVWEGNPAEQVLKAARYFHAERIVLGTRSRGKLSKLLIGSVAERVLREAHVPVVTLGPGAHWKLTGGEHVVLHATQLLGETHPRAELARHVASVLRARLTLIHVIPAGSKAAGEPDAKVDVKLKGLAEKLGGSVTVEAHLVHGDVPGAIVAEAVKRKADLIVLGSTPRPALHDFTRRRTVYEVLAHAPCPVMTLQAETAAKK